MLRHEPAVGGRGNRPRLPRRARQPNHHVGEPPPRARGRVRAMTPPPPWHELLKCAARPHIPPRGLASSQSRVTQTAISGRLARERLLHVRLSILRGLEWSQAARHLALDHDRRMFLWWELTHHKLVGALNTLDILLGEELHP